MAAPSYSRELDTLAMIALDERTRDIHSTITSLGEKFIKLLNANGRVFVVNDAESVRHPVTYVGGEDPTYYLPDNLGGDSYNFETTAKDPLTQCQFGMSAGSMNINFPQSHPSGDLTSYVDARVGAVLEDVFNLEERLALTGDYRDSTMQGEQFQMAYQADTAGAAATSAISYNSRPTNLLSMLTLGTEESGMPGEIDQKAKYYAGVKASDLTTDNWQPYKADVTTASTLVGFFDDVQQAIMETTYTEREKPTHMLTTKTVFAKVLDLLRTEAALPDPVHSNLVREDGMVPIGGLQMLWSRYIEKAVEWDYAAGTTAHQPILGININSLRMNVTKRGGGVPGDAVGIFDYVGDGSTLAHTLPILYRRLAWKRNYSFDKGRRSMFCLAGATI